MKKWTQQDTTAHRGIAKIYRVVTDMGYIWRPTANSDVGLDGEIELVEDRAATAKIIRVQVKSGSPLAIALSSVTKELLAYG